MKLNEIKRFNNNNSNSNNDKLLIKYIETKRITKVNDE